MPGTFILCFYEPITENQDGNDQNREENFFQFFHLRQIYFLIYLRSSGIFKEKGVSQMAFVRGNKEIISKLLIYGAVISVLFSIAGWIGRDIWLASTQWLLVAAVLALFGIYLK